MVTTFTEAGKQRQLILTPNRSMGWHQNLRIILAVTVAITIASIPVILLGGWVVIPFAILHIGALSVGLYVTLRKLNYHEVITVQDGLLSLERGGMQLETSHTFPQSAVNILVEEHSLPIHAPDIDLVAEGHCYPIGEFLNRDDRFELASRLKNQLNLRISHLNSFHRVSF